METVTNETLFRLCSYIRHKSAYLRCNRIALEIIHILVGLQGLLTRMYIRFKIPKEQKIERKDCIKRLH